ncbi:hypothetical protein OsI_18558 [Oryza sativa Indica Group]|uniref:Uncharacterized protein n=1 Tax=Oryza sativa subsp. indica TaxID=39946 RepID=A2Y0N4_ORYSI|nr:hypothetical protein OsI_18558 [Oryza sativa Indica Group]
MPPKRGGTMKTTAAAAAGATGTAGASPVGGGPAGDASAAAGRRVTRLRSRELGLEATTGAGEDVASDDPGPARKKGKVQPATKGAKGKAARADPPTPPPRPRLPPYPKSGDPMDILKWDTEFRRICALPEPAGTVIPCTVRRKPTGPRTVSVTDIASVADNSMIRKASRSVVGISSRIPDGKEIMQCSGIVVDWNKTSRSTAEGQLLFFNAHYRIALLEALVDSPLEPANFGSSPKFGQKVFALARDRKSSFFARSGTVLLQDPPFFLKYKYWLSLSSAIELCGTGGPAIDERGDVAGMTFGRLPNPDLLSISILQTCIDMWRRFREKIEDISMIERLREKKLVNLAYFSRVARPFLDMDLIAFETLDISHQEEIESEHGITDGFIVDLVRHDSTAGRVGISRGDVIVSYNGLRDFTLHTFEEYLLNLGWGFLESTDPSWTINLELEIYDPVRRTIRGVTFPLGFSDICEDVLVLP